MKKISILVLALIISLLLCSCGGASQGNEETQKSEAVITLQHKIDKALESEPSYDDLMEIKNLYDDLLNDEQAQITNYDKIESMFSLSEETVGCIYATNKLMSQLKNPNSLNLISASCYSGSNSMYIKIEYSADNNLGGTVEDEYYCMVDIPTESNGIWTCELEEQFQIKYTLDLFNGSNKAQTLARENYDKIANSAIEVSTNQIMDNIDLEIADSE